MSKFFTQFWRIGSSDGGHVKLGDQFAFRIIHNEGDLPGQIVAEANAFRMIREHFLTPVVKECFSILERRGVSAETYDRQADFIRKELGPEYHFQFDRYQKVVGYVGDSK